MCLENKPEIAITTVLSNTETIRSLRKKINEELNLEVICPPQVNILDTDTLAWLKSIEREYNIKLRVCRKS